MGGEKRRYEIVIQESESIQRMERDVPMGTALSTPPPHENGSVFEVRDPVSPSFAQLCPRGCGKDKARLTTLWLFPCEMAGRKSMRQDRMQGTKRLLRKRGLGDMVMKDFRSWRRRRPLEWTDLLGRQEAKL